MGGRKSGKEEGPCNVMEFVEKEVYGVFHRTDMKCILTTGWKWVMQLWTTDEKWADWIQIRRTNRPGVDIGVFSARDFPKGSTIGYCCGSVILGGNKGDNSEHSRCDVQEKSGEKEEEGGVVRFRNSKAKWQTVKAKKVLAEDSEKQPLFFGMHYVNSACHGFVPDSREFEKAARNQNCVLLEDGSMKALKKIYPNVEILRR
jgi:hypothetical protein